MVDHGGGVVTLECGSTLHLRYLVRVVPETSCAGHWAILTEISEDGTSTGIRVADAEAPALIAAWVAWAKLDLGGRGGAA